MKWHETLEDFKRFWVEPDLKIFNTVTKHWNEEGRDEEDISTCWIDMNVFGVGGDSRGKKKKKGGGNLHFSLMGSDLFFPLFINQKDWRWGSLVLDGASTVKSPQTLTGLWRSFVPTLQGILYETLSSFSHREFKLARRCVCITSNISTMN